MYPFVSLSVSLSLRLFLRLSVRHSVSYKFLTTKMFPTLGPANNLNFNCYRSCSMQSRQNSFCLGANSLLLPN